jgi:hypothetical protein
VPSLPIDLIPGALLLAGLAVFVWLTRRRGQSMSAKELAELVVKVRAVQQSYFRTRSPETLEESRRLERLLDKAAEEILKPPAPTLFD